MLKRIFREITPPIVWRAAKRLIGRPLPASYQGVSTPHSMDALHSGRFREIFEKYLPLDPFRDKNDIRLRVYNVCHFAQHALRAPGDFVFAGVSFGVTPRVAHEYLDFQSRDRSFHLVDPFSGVNNAADPSLNPEYNADVEYVRKQYSSQARIVFHRVFIPDGLPLIGVRKLAFVHLNTSDARGEAAALSYLYECLSPGGLIVIDLYAFSPGHQSHYAQAIEALGVTPFCMVSGQAVIMKP